MNAKCLLRKALVTISFSTIGLAAGTASAADQQVNAGGQLIGASDVSVLGTLYDVSFVEGTCAAVFSGCDEPSDLAFTNEESGIAAAQALLDQVFLDTGAGMFDTRPELTFGCAAFDTLNFCSVLIPSDVSLGAAFGTIATNSTPPIPDGFSLLSVPATADTSQSPTAVWAVFDFSAQQVPEPTTVMLIGLALAGLGFRRRKRAAN